MLILFLTYDVSSFPIPGTHRFSLPKKSLPSTLLPSPATSLFLPQPNLSRVIYMHSHTSSPSTHSPFLLQFQFHLPYTIETVISKVTSDRQLPGPRQSQGLCSAPISLNLPLWRQTTPPALFAPWSLSWLFPGSPLALHLTLQFRPWPSALKSV